MFTTVSELQQTFPKAVKMISSLLSIEIRVHVIDNGNNETRSGRVERDAGGDEKQLIKFSWPYLWCSYA